MVNTPEYQLAKFLDERIKPCLPNEYLLESTKHFLGKLNNFTSQKNQVTVSFDVVFLYQSTPLAETIGLIAN